MLALAGAIWLYVRRGGRRPEPVHGIPPAADPAEELRRKLEQTKEREAAVSHLASPEPDPEPAEVLGVEPPQADPPEPVEPSAPAEPGPPSAPVVSEELDARRREVHERARSAADDMRGTSEH